MYYPETADVHEDEGMLQMSLLRVASPRFLLRHSRYAILGIILVAAIVTPTSDVFNLMLSPSRRGGCISPESARASFW